MLITYYFFYHKLKNIFWVLELKNKQLYFFSMLYPPVVSPVVIHIVHLKMALCHTKFSVQKKSHKK